MSELAEKKRPYYRRRSLWFLILMALFINVVCIFGSVWLALQTQMMETAAASMLAQGEADYSSDALVPFAPLDESIILQVTQDGRQLQATPDAASTPVAVVPLHTVPATATATETAVPSPTITPSPTNSATATPFPTASATPTTMPTDTATPTATATFWPTATATPLPTATDTPVPPPPPPTATATATATASATATATMTATSTATPTATLLPTETPTATATPIPDHPLIPILECVELASDDGFVAHFGYLNENDIIVTIPIGSRNFFAPPPDDRGQPVEFLPGRQEYVFSAESPGHVLTWHLDGTIIIANSNGSPCDG
jgi:hypothetical protein